MALDSTKDLFPISLELSGETYNFENFKWKNKHGNNPQSQKNLGGQSQPNLSPAKVPSQNMNESQNIPANKADLQESIIAKKIVQEKIQSLQKVISDKKAELLDLRQKNNDMLSKLNESKTKSNEVESLARAEIMETRKLKEHIDKLKDIEMQQSKGPVVANN